MHFPPVAEQILHLKRGVQEIIPEEELRTKLLRAEETGKPLTVKLGCDPSRPDLHLGHAVVLRKLRQFQDFGHEIVLIVGDFTGMIGDASGRSKMRPALSLEETRRNGETYFQQALQILHSDRIRIVYNSEWLGKLSFEDVVRLAGKSTVARMLERDDFSGRYAKGDAIGLHEFLYPLAQAQDSVEIEADVELGGTDQKFNLLMGRAVQKSVGQEPQVCITLPILEGLDGAEKMSKSLDNYIGLTESPETMYGKVLSIPDTLTYRYFELASDEETADLPALKKLCATNPRDAKHRLAFSITRLYHGAENAAKARDHFERTVIRKQVPDDVPSFQPEIDGPVGLLNLLTMAGLTPSNGVARRLVEQGAVSIDGQKITDSRLVLDIAERAPFLIKVGKRRFVQIIQ
ncbi:MAG: tyrosine--tRNA ligase [Rhodothermaceae bacterium]|nr:tyrosine--tRNA ligase [Rhodothermaceae bacterium]MXZ58654.1 tyrosine--tRNA ligase [Rhodothermaceae bacterium]MYB90984.1 tyrosine--tRNA ligase [Rhodothermaceae bacterium]MYD66967.1 tyrosine--tRNA ligase [Rhodothermaceae bacterium]MYG44779.1 tyrosine--tRNA ligase [Rhodothermaceae bacterium]